jgi:hypothetical protein
MTITYSINQNSINQPSITLPTSYATATWNMPNSQFLSSNGTSIATIPHGENTLCIEKTATLEVKGNMIINGVDLEERLATIEKVLFIPERDVKLEAKHPKLKKLYDDYIKELSKHRMWESIKGSNEKDIL